MNMMNMKRLSLAAVAAVAIASGASAQSTGKRLGKALVVFYSASGTTEKAAKLVAQAAGADIFEVKCDPPYSPADWDWTDKSSRVCKEYADPKLRKVKLETTVVPHWEEYDTVFVGYPIWWGIAAWPMTTFVGANDFTGKTVIPFATAYSSGLGNSAKLLEREAKGGKWLSGTRFLSNSISEAGVKSWVGKLKL